MEKTLKLLLLQNERILCSLENIEQRLGALEAGRSAPSTLPALRPEPASNDQVAEAPVAAQEASPSADANRYSGVLKQPANKTKERWLQELDSIAQVVDSIKDITAPDPYKPPLMQRSF